MEIYSGFKHPQNGYCIRKIKGIINEREIMIEVSGALEKKVKDLFMSFKHLEKTQNRAREIFSYAFRASIITSFVFVSTKISTQRQAQQASFVVAISALFVALVSLSTICVCDLQVKRLEMGLSEKIKEALIKASDKDVEFYVQSLYPKTSGVSFNNYQEMKSYITSDSV